MVNLSRVDLNLLVVLETILAEGGVGRAAAKLNLTQPTISHALGRLRELFRDPLFVRQGRTLMPTPLARNLAEPLRAALRSMEGLLSVGNRFEPAETAASFTVAMRDPMELVVLPAMAKRLTREAPFVQLRSIQTRRREIESGLGDGTLDAAIDVPLLLSDRIRRLKISSGGFVVVARKSHSVLGKRMTLAKYLRCDHVMVTSRRQGPAPEDLALGQAGQHRRIRLRCRSYAAAFRVVEQTDLILTMPRRYASLLGSSQTLQHPMPIEIPSLDVFLYWHESVNADAANCWLREQILEVLGRNSSVSRSR